MKRYLLGAVALVAIGSVAYGQRELSPLLSTQNADNATFYPRNSYPNGAFHPMGVLHTTTATHATGSGTGEQILDTYTLPAGSLYTAGNRLHIRAVFHAATNGNNKTMIIYFGNVTLSTGVITESNTNTVLEMDVVKSGASTQIVTSGGLINVTPITTAVNTSGAVTDTSDIVIKATGTDGSNSAGDIVLDDFSVTFMT